MADLSITAANVVAQAGAITDVATFGATVTAGQMIYKDTADASLKLADNNSATAAARTPLGMALNGGAAGQPCKFIKEGDVAVGTILTAGVAYYLSDTPGGICPVADLASGEYPTVIGIAISTSVLRIKINASGVAL